MASGASCDPDIVAAFSHYNLNDEEQRAKRHLRRLFWLSYVIDKELALQTGQPPSINDDYCDLSLPTRDFGLDSMESGPNSSLWNEISDDWVIYPANLRLITTMSRVSRSLYSASALRLEDAELLRNVRELDYELENWRLSIPAEHRPSLLNTRQQVPRPDTTDNSAANHMDTVKSDMQLKYYYLLAAIHLASGRCKGWCKEERDELEGVSSSIAISIEASRSLLIHLRASIQFYIPEAFW